MNGTRSDAPLRVLLVEDSDDDARLEILALERSGLIVSSERVDTLDALTSALAMPRWDIILADYTLPSFSGVEALKLAQQLRSEVPFIVVSGTITEEMAVAAMKAGAEDYVLKNNLARLAPAVRREVLDAELRAEHARTGRELIGVRARAAEELERSRHQLEIILRGVAEAIVAEGEDGRVVYANDAAARGLGVQRPEELLGAKVDDVFRYFEVWDEAGTRIESASAAIRTELEDGHPEERVLRLRNRRTQEDRWYIVTSTAMGGTATSAPMIITIARDITERRRAELDAQYLATTSAALAGSLELRVTLEMVTHLAVPTLGDWCVIDLRDEGLPSRRVEAPLAAAHADPDRSEAARTLWSLRAQEASARAMATGSAELLEIAGSTAGSGDGAGASSLLIVALVTHGRPFGTLTCGRDGAGRPYGPSELSLAEEVARRASFALENARLYEESQDAIRARDEFLAVASHELRTPLTALTLQLHVAQRHARSTQLPTRLDAAVRHVKRLANLIDSLLDASRITAGRMKVQPEEIDLGAAVRDVVEQWEDEARKARCEIVVRAPSSVRGWWDRVRIDQVVTNLVSNALKYGAGAPVEISVSKVGTSARLAVTDHGIGIPAEDVARIFGKFERAVTARHYGGLGLGLFIARQIVEAHGGTIRVESAPGAGSTFVVELPLRTAALETPVEAQRAS